MNFNTSALPHSQRSRWPTCNDKKFEVYSHFKSILKLDIPHYSQDKTQTSHIIGFSVSYFEL